jgi:hypothetical protein
MAARMPIGLAVPRGHAPVRLGVFGTPRVRHAARSYGMSGLRRGARHIWSMTLINMIAHLSMVQVGAVTRGNAVTPGVHILLIST